MRTMEHRERSKEIVVKPGLKGFVRDGHVKPILLGIELLKIKRLKQCGGEQRAAETTVTTRVDHLPLLTASIEVRIINLALSIDRDRGSNATLSVTRRTIYRGAR